jgi:putative transcriptional regulator
MRKDILKRNYPNEGRHNLSSLDGKVLVALPGLEHQDFERTLIYLIRHGDNGSIGVVLNKKISTFSVKEVLAKVISGEQKIDDFIRKLDHDPSFDIGGGTMFEKGVILCSDVSGKRCERVNLYFEPNEFFSDLRDCKIRPKNFIIAQGFAVWGVGQLEYELVANRWLLADARTNIIFSTDIEDEWERVVRSIGIKNLDNFVHYCGCT